MITGFYAAWTYVSRLDRSLAFYTGQLGLPVRYREDNWVELALGETTLALLERPAERGPVEPRKLRIMLQVDDIALCQETLAQAGIKMIGHIHHQAYGKLLTLVDPDGHWLELFEAPP